MIPFARSMELWHSGLAGSLPSAGCFVIAACFLFSAVRRVFGSTSAAVAATAIFVFNPNALYLQSTAMTEPVFFAAFCGLFYATAAFAETKLPRFVFLARSSAPRRGTLIRYEGWFLLPFVALFFYLAAQETPLAREPGVQCCRGAGPCVVAGLQLLGVRQSAGVLQRGRISPGHSRRQALPRSARLASCRTILLHRSTIEFGNSAIFGLDGSASRWHC